MNLVQVMSLQVEALSFSVGKIKHQEVVAGQVGPQTAWLCGHSMSLPHGDNVLALLTRRVSGTVTYAIGSCPVSSRQGQSLNKGANGI